MNITRNRRWFGLQIKMLITLNWIESEIKI